MIWLLSMRALSAHSAGVKEPPEAQCERGGERTEWHSSSRIDASFVSAGNQSKCKCDEDPGSWTKEVEYGIERTKYARPKGVMYLAKVNGVLLAGRDARTGFYAPQ